MPVVSKYCDKCGIKIPIEDFEDGHALEYGDGYYCRNCKGDVVRSSDRKPAESSDAPEPAPATSPGPKPMKKIVAPKKRSRISAITGKGGEAAPAKEERVRKAPESRKAARAAGPSGEVGEPARPAKKVVKVSDLTPEQKKILIARKKKKLAAQKAAAEEAARQGGEPAPAATPPRKKLAKPAKAAAPVPKGRDREGKAPGKVARTGKPGRPGKRGVAPVDRRGSALQKKRGRAAPDAAEDVEPGDEEGAPEVRGKKPYIIVGGVGAGLMVVAVVAILLIKGGGSDKPDGGGSGQAVVTQEELLQPQRDAIQFVKDYIADRPDDPLGIEKTVGEARKIVEDPDLLDELISIGQEGIASGYALLVQKAGVRLQEAEDAVEELLFSEAMQIIREMPTELQDQEFWLQVIEVEKKIKLYQAADTYVAYYMNRASNLFEQGKFDEALGTLDAINMKRLNGTPLRSIVDQELAQISEGRIDADSMEAMKQRRVKRLAAYEDRVKKYAGERQYSAAWEEVDRARTEYAESDLASKVEEIADWLKNSFHEFIKGLAAQSGERQIGNNLLFWNIRAGVQNQNPDTWEIVKDGTLKGEVSGGGSTIGIGDARWQDYLVKFEAKVDLGTVHCGLRMRGSFGGSPDHVQVSLKGAERQWKQFQFIAWGMKYYQVDPATGEVTELSPKIQGSTAHPNGAVGFVIDGGGSVQIRNMFKVVIKDAS